MADKTREEKEIKETNRDIDKLRKEFWTELLAEFNAMSTLFKNINPGFDHWLSAGVSGASFEFVVTKSYAGVDLLFGKDSQEENKRIFDNMFMSKAAIDEAYGPGLSWERLDEKKSSRIADRLKDVDITKREEWKKIKDFLCQTMLKFEKVLKDPLKKAASKK